MSWLRRGDSGLSLPLFALAHVGIFAGLFRGPYSTPSTGTGLFYAYAGRILSGQLPYRDFVAEYPPLALFFFTAPRVLGESFRWYYVWYQTEVVLADLLILAVLYAAARRLDQRIVDVLGAYTLVVLAVGPVLLQQFDIFPAALTLLAVVAFADDRPIATGLLLALGTMTKVYPALLAPVFLLVAWRRGARRDIAKAIGAFVAGGLLCLVPWLARDPGSIGTLLGYHTARPIQIESTWATLAFLGRAIGLTYVDVGVAYGSWNVTGPLPDLFLRVSTIVLIAALLMAYLWADRVVARPEAARHRLMTLARAAAVVLLAALAASKVFSPQYLVWVMPFIPLVEPERRTMATATFVAIALLTFYIFPVHYEELLARDPLPIAALTLRNALVIGLALLLARSHRIPSAVAA